MANRQIARDLNVSASTVDKQLDRLGRHCLLFQTLRAEERPSPQEITIDSIESFEFSQYFPFNFHVAVEDSSGMFVSFTDSPLRRKGRMTNHQKERRLELEAHFGRPDPQAVRKDVYELLRAVTRDSRNVVLRSDDHASYRTAINQLSCRVSHRVTSSKQKRDKRNPLWEINLLDLLIRHSGAGHKRETLAWPKRRAKSALRLAVFLVWRNWVNWRWQKRCRSTPAMMSGWCDRGLTVAEILRTRLFPSQIDLTDRWRQYYWASIKTLALPINRRYDLKYAT